MARRIEKSDIRAGLKVSGEPSSDFDLNAAIRPPAGVTLKPAGVLLPIIDRPTGPHMVLTKRSSTIRHHPGQIAFPGGRVDPEDIDHIDAALREATEEIGLPREIVEVLGELPHHITVSNYTMHPVVGWVREPFVERIEVGEVAEVFEVPLDHVLDPSRFVIQSRRWRGAERKFYTVPYGPYYIWGATARVLRSFADRMAM